jgi:hypothetical protein
MYSGGKPSVYIRNIIIAEARNLVFKKIEVERTFTPLDIYESKSQYAAWSYS